MAIDTNVLDTVRPSRRSVVRGAAWSVPVVSLAATAPAFAASCGSTDVDYLLDWGNTGLTTYAAPVTPGGGTGNKVGTATVLAPAGSGGTSLLVTFTSAVFNSVARASDNLTISSETDIGNLGTGVRGLNISHDSPISSGRANRQEVSISFSRAVTGLSFTITDIDSAAGNWWDRVELSGVRTGTPVARTRNRGNYVLGDGTNTTETATSGPWRFYDDDTNVANSGNDIGNIAVNYPGTIAANTPIVLTYWTTVGGGNQRIFLSDFTFTAKGC